MSEATAPPPFVVSDMRKIKLLKGDGIVASFNLTVSKWRFTFYRCYWRRQDGEEHIELPANCGNFYSEQDRRRFNEVALEVVRKYYEDLGDRVNG